MKKFLFLLLAFVFWQCKHQDDEPHPPTIDINEGQTNWSKVQIAQRPIGDLPSQNPGEYCPVRVLPAFTSSDTISFFVNFYKIYPYTSVFISYHNAQMFIQKIAFDGSVFSLDQAGIYAYGLRQYVNTYYFGRATHYGTAWTWTPLTNLPYQIIALSPDTVFLLHRYGLNISFNGGSQWSLISSTSFNRMFKFNHQVWLSKENELYVIKNLQGGPQLRASLPHGITAFDGKDSLLLAGTQQGNIFLSKDTGHTWLNVYQASLQFPTSSTFQISDIHMVDASHGFAILNAGQPFYYSSSYPTALSLILRTSDGGLTWTPNYISQLLRLEKFTQLGNNIIAVGYQPAHPYLSSVYILVTSTMGN